MAWVRLEDGFTEHPKVYAAGPLASWLFVCGLSYANRNLTDGFIPDGAVSGLSDVPSPRKLAAKLVQVGLWERVDGGYLIHDYLDYQPSAGRVRQTREQTAARVTAFRGKKSEPANGAVTALHARLNSHVTHDVTPPPVPVPVPVPSRSPEQQQPGPEKQQPEGESAAAAPPAAAVPSAGFLFGSAGWKPPPEQLVKLRQIADRRGLDLELEAMKITDWLNTTKGQKQQCTFRFVAGWLEREQSIGSKGHGENRQHPGRNGAGSGAANAGAGAGAAGEDDPFAKYVRRDPVPSGDPGSP